MTGRGALISADCEIHFYDCLLAYCLGGQLLITKMLECLRYHLTDDVCWKPPEKVICNVSTKVNWMYSSST